MRRNSEPVFVPLPADEQVELAWPTANRNLFTHLAAFVARTRANPDYGKPGWTRDGGRRFHRGIDIAPIHPVATGQTTTVQFTNTSTGEEYLSDEPTFSIDEEVFAVCAGEVVEINPDPDGSTFGLYVLLKHQWPGSGHTFNSLYAHLGSLNVTVGQSIASGQRIGTMGQTSSSADARNWMRIAPHLHLEFHDAEGNAYDPLAMLQNYLPR